MMVSITAVSANRKMTKTLVRASGTVNRLREAFSDIAASSAPFDTLQFVLMDRPGGYVHLQGARGGDRLFQVHIGAGGLPCGPGQEGDFVAALVRAMGSAVNHLPVSESTVAEMFSAIERVSTELGGAANRSQPVGPDPKRTPPAAGSGG
jgi:hypothetical protein